MDSENLIKEGFFDTLIRAVIPKSIQKQVSKAAQEKLKKKLEISKKKIEKLQKQSDDIKDNFTKALEKQYGYKPNKKKIDNLIKKRK